VLVGSLVAGGLDAAPRVRAAWQLRTVATAFADYALCMADRPPIAAAQ
jgi:hypothetical protein